MLSHKKPDSRIGVTMDFEQSSLPLKEIEQRADAQKPKENVSYKMIQDYIENKYQFKVHTAYIAEVKRSLGLPMYDAPNGVDEPKRERQHPTEKMMVAIKDAFNHFGIVQTL